MDALGLVPPEIMRYVIARGKVGRHIDFDTGPALFQIADEYERLVAEPPSGSDEELSRRQQIARDTQLAALKLSQIERGADPAHSIAGVSFRHLSVLAQVKSSDEDVWAALRKSGHLEDGPRKSLELRLRRMRAWLDGPYFPDEERIHVRSQEDLDFKDDLSSDQVLFLSALSRDLVYSKWTPEKIEECIRKTVSEIEIANKDAYAAIYWAMHTKWNGPRASSLLSVLDRKMVLGILRHARGD
jgi:lysyl-tRNA synthetase class 1